MTTPLAEPCTANSEINSPGSPDSMRSPRTRAQRQRRSARRPRTPAISLGRKQKQSPEQMVEPATRAAEDEDPLRLEPQRRRKRELEIGGVLVHRVPLDALDARQRLRRDRVQIAHHADRSGPPSSAPAVGRDHHPPAGRTRTAAGRSGPPARTTTVFTRQRLPIRPTTPPSAHRRLTPESIPISTSHSHHFHFDSHDESLAPLERPKDSGLRSAPTRPTSNQHRAGRPLTRSRTRVPMKPRRSHFASGRWLSAALCDDRLARRADLEDRCNANPNKIRAYADPHDAGKLRCDVDEKADGR